MVVELLQGADNLPEVVRSFDPGEDARLGVLLDHLVPGSKESRIAETVGAALHVLVLGHPFVDILAGGEAGAARAAGVAGDPEGAVLEGRDGGPAGGGGRRGGLAAGAARRRAAGPTSSRSCWVRSRRSSTS